MGVLKWALIAAFPLILAPAAAHAALSTPGEYEVKAAFLYNFTKFVDWPPESFPSPEAPVSLCVLGEADPFNGNLETVVKGETLNGHPLAVRHLRETGQARDCHVLFISRAEKGRSADAVAALKGTSVLTVGEGDGFLEQGGMIRLFLDHNRVRFDINVDAAEQGHLQISSKLLRLARTVNPQRRGA